MKYLVTVPATIVLYESVHRLMRTLDDLGRYFGEDQPVCIAREVTKKFEEFTRGTIAECREHFTKKNPKGEFVIVIGRRVEVDSEED